MSLPLFFSNIKNNRTIWLIMLVVYSFYFTIIISMFDPEGMEAWDEMLGMMPEGFLQALGWDMMGTTLTGTDWNESLWISGLSVSHGGLHSGESPPAGNPH